MSGLHTIRLGVASSPRLSAARGGGGAPPADPQATHWRQPSAADAKFLQASSVPYAGVAGTIIAPVNLTGIGSSRGGILHLTDAAESAYLAVIPGSPDVLRGHLDIGGTPTTVDVAFSADDHDLYDGFPKVAWMEWENGGNLRVGWNDPASGLVNSAACGSSLAGGTATVSVANSGGAGGSIGGEFEVALFDRVLTDPEKVAVLAASTLRSLAPGDAVLYPQPATGVVEDDIITTPATQVVDEAAYTYAIVTTDGLAPIQAAGDISDVGRFIGSATLPANAHIGEALTVSVEVRGTGSYSLTYQWHYNGADLPGEESATGPAISAAQEGGLLGCRVALSAGSGTQTVESTTCRVYCYGLASPATNSDVVRTVSTAVVPQADTTTLALASTTSINSRGVLLVWGNNVDIGTPGNVGSLLQYDPTGSDTLKYQVAETGVTTMATAAVLVPGGNAADGVPRLSWGTISADGTTATAGIESVTPVSIAITGGPDPTPSGYGSINRRPNGAIASASAGIYAVLSRAWTPSEAAAIAGAANPRQALLAFLVAERALGNVRWWPIAVKVAGSSITSTADLLDLGDGGFGVALGASSSRMTVQGP